jgi:glutathione S-transferase
MTTTIYHAEARRSERIAWLLEELGRPYELVFRAGDVMGSFEPLRTTGHSFPMAPVVEDGGDLMIESAAIMETLLNRYGEGRLRPAIQKTEHVRYLEWLHFAESTAWPRIQQEFITAPCRPPRRRKRRRAASAARPGC